MNENTKEMKFGLFFRKENGYEAISIYIFKFIFYKKPSD